MKNPLKIFAAVGCALALWLTATTAAAQTDEARIDRLNAEIRVLLDAGAQVSVSVDYDEVAKRIHAVRHLEASSTITAATIAVAPAKATLVSGNILVYGWATENLVERTSHRTGKRITPLPENWTDYKYFTTLERNLSHRRTYNVAFIESLKNNNSAGVEVRGIDHLFVFQVGIYEGDGHGNFSFTSPIQDFLIGGPEFILHDIHPYKE